MEKRRRNNIQATCAKIQSIRDNFYVQDVLLNYPTNEMWAKGTPIWFKEDQDSYTVYTLPMDFSSTEEMIQFILNDREA